MFKRLSECLVSLKKTIGSSCGGGRAVFFAYCAFLCLLTWLTGFVLPLGMFWQRQGGVRHFFEANIPEFTIQNGKLSVPGGYHREARTDYVDINTDSESQD